MDCSPPGSSVHRTLHARTLEWVAMPSSRGSSRPRDHTQVSCIAGGFLTTEPLGKPTLLICTYKRNLSAQESEVTGPGAMTILQEPELTTRPSSLAQRATPVLAGLLACCSRDPRLSTGGSRQFCFGRQGGRGWDGLHAVFQGTLYHQVVPHTLCGTCYPSASAS